MFNLESKWSVTIGIVNESDNFSTADDVVCAEPVWPLWTRKTFSSSNILRTWTISWSVTPIATVEPTDILFGIVET